MERAEHSSAFSALGSPKAKVVLLGSTDRSAAGVIEKARSLKLEHVSPVTLAVPEISRRHTASLPAAVRAELGQLAAMRKWFWARKPDAGFLLEGFPATLLQAKVFDEWLDARGENLTAVHAAPSASAELVHHYRTQGLASASSRPAARQDMSLSNV